MGMDPRQALRSLVERNVRVQLPIPGVTTKPRRESAVLILFGRLDAIPAGTGALSLPDDASRELPADLDVLLLRRADTMRYHPGQVAFPGGGVDPEDAGPVAAALREAEEETGLDPTGVEVIGVLPPIPLAVSDNIVTPVIGWWVRPSEIAAVDRTESAQVFRAPVAELLNPAARGIIRLRHRSQQLSSPAFQLEEWLGGHIIWGFTGMVLAQLFDELGWTQPWDESREFRRPGL